MSLLGTDKTFQFHASRGMLLVQKCKRFAPPVGNEYVPLHRGAVVPCPKGGLSKSSGICGSTVSSLVFRITLSTQWASGRGHSYVEGATRHTWRPGAYSEEHINHGRAEIHATDRKMGNSHLLMLHSLLRRTSEWAAGL